MEYLDPRPGDVIVDGTLGLGGHAEAILERIAPGGKLIGLDRDEKAIEMAKERLGKFGKSAMLIKENYKNVAARLKDMGEAPVRGMLLDLGISSMQVDDAQRGFSFMKEAPLDMRMDRASALTAKEIINKFSKEELLTILWEYAEERFARRIVDRILVERARHEILTTTQLAQIIFTAVPASYRHGRIHPATRSFQGLRIAVNKEIEALRLFLENGPDVLADGGRLVIISFHSLEDRLVKTAFRKYKSEGLGEILTKRPVGPSQAEESKNPRSRSAKLRAFRKTSEALS
jgi:16S rRNA (cytosine1402-N4)-methyltransferase